jgi:hypothetical protein
MPVVTGVKSGQDGTFEQGGIVLSVRIGLPYTGSGVPCDTIRVSTNPFPE